MSGLKIQRWGEASRLFELDSNNMTISQVEKYGGKHSVDGFIKTFLFGKKIIVFENEDEWFVMVKKYNSRLSKLENVKVTRKYGFTVLSFSLDKISFSFWDFTPLDSLSSYIDPTYDEFDSESVFGFWFKNLHPNPKL